MTKAKPMKKYMLTENIEILKDFDISGLEVLINNRCDRTYCVSCGSVGEEKTCKCTWEKDKKIIRASLGTGENTILRDGKHLHHEVEEDGTHVFFYYDVLANVVMGTGVVSFAKRPVKFLSVKDDEFKVISYYGLTDIGIDSVLQILKDNNVNHDSLINMMELCKICGFHSWSYFQKYYVTRQRGHDLMEDVEFVKAHTTLIRKLLGNSYSDEKINSIEGMCKYLEIPMCLSEYAKDPYFSKLEGYADIRLFDSHPVEIQGCFAYYISSGKFNRRTIKTYLDTFDIDFWDSRNKISTFLTYVKKNLWMGDAVFVNAMKTFKYVNEKKYEINEDTINSKFANGMQNVDAFADKFGSAASDEFHQIRETQGIVPALKQLLVWTTESEDA